MEPDREAAECAEMEVSAPEPAAVYDHRFFETIEQGCTRSAQAAVPVIVEWLRPVRVIDVGCGEGAWAAAFAAARCAVLAVDGEYVSRHRLRIAEESFVPVDLRCPLPASVLAFGADLVVCLEVAEHLPPWRAEGLVDDLCAASARILFSAAVPGQGGYGHLNERPSEYWAQLFEERGYAVSRRVQRLLAPLGDVEWWYRQNAMLMSLIPGTAGGRVPRLEAGA